MSSDITALKIYRSLKDDEIRVITLRAGSFDSPVRVSLEHITTTKGCDAASAYDALSYEWGQTKWSTKTIFIEESPVRIGNNLFLALKYFREESRDLRLWVDALCINQYDTRERNHQVQLMGTIYSQARAVIAWLGPESKDSTAGFQYVRDWMSENQDRCYQNKQGYNAYCNLYFRSYWSRLWIIQEFVLAQKAVLACGKEKMEWGSFDSAAEGLGLWMSQGRKDPFMEVMRSRCWRVGSIRSSRPPTASPGSLYDLLKETHGAACQDPRDRVYGLLGLLSVPKEALPPVDYGKSIFEVFEDVLNYYGSSFTNDESVGRETIGRVYPKLFAFSREVQHALGITATSNPYTCWPSTPQHKSPSSFSTRGFVRMQAAEIGPTIGTPPASYAIKKWECKFKKYLANPEGSFLEISNYKVSTKYHPFRVCKRDTMRIRAVEDVLGNGKSGSCEVTIAPSKPRFNDVYDKDQIYTPDHRNLTSRTRRPKLAYSHFLEIAIVPWNTEKGDIICQFRNTDICIVLSGQRKRVLKGTAVILRCPDALLKNEPEATETIKFSAAHPAWMYISEYAHIERTRQDFDEVFLNMDIRMLQFLTV